MLGLALGSAVLTFWVSGEFAGESPAPRTMVKRVIAPEPSGVVIPSENTRGSAGMAGLVHRLRSASSSELAREFAATGDYALRCAIIVRWAAIDPAGCAAALQNHGAKFPRDIGTAWGMEPLLFAQWAQVDHAAARDALASWPGGSTAGLSSFVESCARMGGPAWEALLDDPRFSQINPGVGIYPRLRGAPGSEVRSVLSSAEALRRGRYALVWLQDFNRPWSGISTEDFAAWKKLPELIRASSSRAVLPALVANSPAEAAELMAGMSASARQHAAGPYVEALAKQDAPGAWAWLEKNAQTSREEVARAWGEAAPPEQATAVLAAAAPSLARDAAGVALASEWQKSDPAAAQSWVLGLEDEKMRREIWNGLAPELVQNDPEAGLAAITAPGAPLLSVSRAREISAIFERRSPELLPRFAAALPEHLARALPAP